MNLLETLFDLQEGGMHPAKVFDLSEVFRGHTNKFRLCLLVLQEARCILLPINLSPLEVNGIC